MRARQPAPELMVAVGLLALVVGFVCVALAAQDRSLGYALGVVAGLVALIVVAIEPYYGLTLFLALIYLRPGDRNPALQPLRLTLLVVGSTTLVWLAQYAIRREPRPARHKLHGALFGLFAAALISQAQYSLRAAAPFVIEALAKTMAVHFLIANLVRSARRLRQTCWTVVLLSTTTALQAWQALRAGDERYDDRAAGVGLLGDPNDLALTLVLALPLAIALWQGERGFFRRWLLAAAIVALLGGILVTKSRGGMLGLLVVLFLEGYQRLPWRRWRRRYALVAGTLGVVALGAFLGLRGQSFETVGDDPNVYNRRGAWVGGLRMMLDKPLTGVGLYKFPEFLDQYGPSYLEQRDMTAHNSIVLAAGELGLPGLICFLLLLGYGWRTARRLRELVAIKEVDRLTRRLAPALGRSAVGWFVCAMFLSQAYQVWIFLLTGLLVATEALLERAPDRAAGQESAPPPANDSPGTPSCA